MCDMFLILMTVYFTGYTDDDTLFVMADLIEDVIRSLEGVGENLIFWFSNNQMKLIPDKCHLLLNTEEQITLKIDNLQTKSSLCEKLSDINFNYKLDIEDTCQKVSKS